MKRILLVFLPLLISLIAIPASRESPTYAALTITTTPTVPVNILTMTKLHTNATAAGPCTMNVSTPTGTIISATGTLFGKIRIVVNATWTFSNGTYPVQLANFFLLVTQKNIVVGNSTNVNQNQNPTNTISQVTLFPEIPVIFILSFKPVCVTTGTLARLIYVDGNFSFVFNLP